MKLVIGNKNYSSWSLRPWLLLRVAGIDFEETCLSFDSPTFKNDALAYAPSGKVPALIDGGVVVWDSLAICEYLAEKFPDRKLWPADVAARAEARAVCAEMHSGFQTLRAHMPMNVTAFLPGLGWNLAVQKDIDRVSAIWTGARERHGDGGPFLFGRFTVADAYFAPVVSRLNTYRPAVPDAAGVYMRAILALPAMQQWTREAREEGRFIAEDEPYRVAL
jgi:glutathione S-transferase